MNEKHASRLLLFQRNEITEYNIYNQLARQAKDKRNSRILENIGADELRHYHEWKLHTGRDVAPPSEKRCHSYVSPPSWRS